MARSATDLLDLVPGIGQRIETVRFDIVNPDRSVEFQVTNAEADQVPTISWDGDAAQQRTLNGLVIGPADAARINPIVHRLRPSWVLDTGDTFPLGLFLFSSNDSHVDSWGADLAGGLGDSNVILGQAREATLSLPIGATIREAMLSIIDELGLSAYASVDPSDVLLSAPISWQLGTTRGQILTDLCQAAAFYPPYWDNNAILRLRAVPNPLSAAVADLTFTGDSGSRVIGGSIVTSSDLVKAPNRYIVRGSATNGAEVSAFYDIPASAPHSKDAIGYIRAIVIDNSAVSDAAAAAASAHAAYATDFTTYDWVSFDTSPDPRADGYQVVSFLGTNYRAQSWSLPCTPGGPMSWKCRRVYDD